MAAGAYSTSKHAPSAGPDQTLRSSNIVLRNFAMVETRNGEHEELKREADALMHALRHNFLLRSLDITSPHTREAGGEALMDAITESRCLQSIRIHLGTLTPVGVGIVKGFLLDQHCLLAHLDLSDTVLGNIGTRLLAQGLEGNTSLTGEPRRVWIDSSLLWLR